MGRGDAAVTMQQRLWLFLSPLPPKARFMTSRIPSYFSNSCTPWVVYLGLRAFLWSLSARGFYDLQHTTRGNKKDTVLVLTSETITQFLNNTDVLFSTPKILTTTAKWVYAVKRQLNPEVKFLLRHYTLSFLRTIGSRRASNERSYIHPCPLLCVSLLYPLALPSPLSSGGVIDRLQRFRPPTALSSFRDTLSVLIRAVIGRLAVAEWDQGHGSRETTMTFLRYHLQFFFLISLHPNSFLFLSLFIGS